MTSGLTDKKALIAGAYGGMGRAIAQALAREGVACALLGRDAARLAEVADACGEAGRPGTAIACDIGAISTIKDAVGQSVDALGGLDFLINAAGTHETGRAHEVELDRWDRMLDVNLRAHYHLVRYAVPEINKRPGGAVVKIGSIAASYPGAGLYLATNRATDGYGDQLFEDVREFGTKVCTIRPGFVNTPMVRSGGVDRSRMIQPDDIARTVLFVLTMPETACPTEITIRPQRTPYTNR